MSLVLLQYPWIFTTYFQDLEKNNFSTLLFLIHHSIIKPQHLASWRLFLIGEKTSNNLLKHAKLLLCCFDLILGPLETTKYAIPNTNISNVDLHFCYSFKFYYFFYCLFQRWFILSGIDRSIADPVLFHVLPFVLFSLLRMALT